LTVLKVKIRLNLQLCASLRTLLQVFKTLAPNQGVIEMGLFDVIGDIARVVAPFTGPYAPFVMAGAEIADGIDPGDGDRGNIIGAFTGDTPQGGGGMSLGGLTSLFGASSGTASIIDATASSGIVGSIVSGDQDAETTATQVASLASSYLLNNNQSAAVAPQ
jgi:hypothetical protein